MTDTRRVQTRETVERSTARINRATAFFGVLTGVLTLATAGLGFLSHDQAEKKQQAESHVEDLSGTVTTLRQQNGELTTQNNDLRKQLDAATASPSSSPEPSDGDPQLPPVDGATELLPISSEWVTEWGGWDWRSDLAINGKRYGNGAVAFGPPQASQPPQLEVNLRRGLTTVSGRVGISDQSPSACKAHILAKVDGKTVLSKDFSYGQSRDLKLGVTNALLLQLIVTTSSSNISGCRAAVGGLTGA